MKTKRIDEIIKHMAKQGWDFTANDIIEATGNSNHIEYFDPFWAIDNEEREEFPEGRYVEVDGEFDYCLEADALIHITRDEKHLAVLF